MWRMAYRISSALHQRLLDEARAAHPNECCGLLLGQDNRIADVRACRNVASDPARRFEIDPVALIAALRSARDGGPAVLGFFHSHPGGNAEPSVRDAADGAGDGRLWLIIGEEGVGAWVNRPGGVRHGAFDPAELMVEN